MNMRRLNALLNRFAASQAYDSVLLIVWCAISAAAVFFLPLRMLQIVEGLQ